MSLSQRLTQALACASILASASAFAASNSSTSVTSASKAAPKFFDKLSMGYLGIFAGPSLGSPSMYQPDDQGVIKEADDNRIVLKNALSLGYKLTPEITVGPNFNFNYYPVLPFSNQSMDLADPIVRLSHSKLIQAGNLNVSGDFRFYIPVTETSQNSDLITAFRAWQTTSYEVANTRLSLGVHTYEKFFLFGSSGAANAKRLEAYLAPYLAYQLSKATSLSLMYEMDAVSRANEELTTWNSLNPTVLSLGLAADITPSINLNPFFMVFPGGEMNLDATQFGAYITAKIL